MNTVKLAITDHDIEKCFPVMLELRPHLQATMFVQLVREMQQQGFQLAYIEDNGVVVAVAGYRIVTNLFMGKNLYVDDLITSEKERSKGYGDSLLAWLRALAIENSCHYLHLDSGTHREQAHKFYFRQGLTISSFHFSEALKAE